MDSKTKIEMLTKRHEVLSQVKQYIDNELSPSKANFLDNSKADFKRTPSIQDVLHTLGISKNDYYWALSISETNDFPNSLEARYKFVLC